MNRGDTRDVMRRYARVLGLQSYDERYVEASLVPREQARIVGATSWVDAEQGEWRQRRIPASWLLRESAPKRCFLIGPSGCGKSATSRYLAQQALEGFVDGRDGAAAVLLHARELERDVRYIPGHVARNIASLAGISLIDAEEIARDERLIVLLDGLNEAKPWVHEGLPQSIERWAEENPTSRCIVTSRPLDRPVLESFEAYEFTPLTLDDVDRFARLHLPGKHAERFLEILRNDEKFAGMASSPLLLQVLVNTYLRTGVLPNPSSFSFANLVNTMFPETVDPASRVAMSAVLAHLAKDMTDSGLFSVPLEKLLSVIKTNEQLLPSRDSELFALLNSGILAQESGGRVAFRHRSLLEYFASSDPGSIVPVWKEPLIVPPATIEVVRFVDQKLLERLKNNPQGLYGISPRQFEEVVAELFRDKGWTVELTKQTRDGGADIIAVRSDMGSHLKMLIEAKRFGHDKTIGVGIVRQLYAVRQMHHASKAMLATTSHFSPDVYKQFDSVMPWELELKDFKDILEWLKAYGGSAPDAR